MDPAITTLCVLAVAAFLFVTELIPLAVTAMAACTAHLFLRTRVEDRHGRRNM